MKRIILSLALLVIGATSAFASAKSSSTRQITQVIEQYFSVLGTSNAGALTELFTEDAELLPPGAPQPQAESRSKAPTNMYSPPCV